MEQSHKPVVVNGSILQKALISMRYEGGDRGMKLEMNGRHSNKEVSLLIEGKIQQIFSKHPSVIYGFTNISYSSYASQYRSALVFAVPYGEQLTIKNYTEEKFEKGIQDAKKVLEEILVQVEEMLNEHKVKYYIPL